MITYHQVSELLKEQFIEADDVFCPDGGKFEVLDVNHGIRQKTTIDNEEDFSNFLSIVPSAGKRIVSISADSTIDPLSISIAWTARLLECYHVRTEFLHVILAFGDEPQHSEACNGYKLFRETKSNGYELVYKLNYMEPNHRGGKNPWSTRHLGVYHHRELDWEVYILVHCSRESRLYRSLHAENEETSTTSSALSEGLGNPMSFHDLVMQCYIHHWQPYLRWLGHEFSQINDRAMVANTSVNGPKHFEHLRRLRSIRDRIDIASGYCTSNLDVLVSLRLSQKTTVDSMDMISSGESLVRSHVRSLKLMKDRVDNAIHLISITLEIGNQEQTARLDREMRNLAEETSRVTRKLAVIAENSAKEGQVVRIITIVSAIYLPGSFVTSIFGMNFFQFVGQPGSGEIGRIVMSGDIWIFVSLWLGLTMVTGSIFLYAYIRRRYKDPASLYLDEKQSGHVAEFEGLSRIA